jgi:ferredoxin-NADP reductase
MELMVSQIAWEADGVVSLRLVDPDGRDLPAWEPGAHLDIRLPSGTIRQYSLCGAVDDHRSYRIAVLREAQGRGGSAEIHDTALVGRTVSVKGPKNHFPLEESKSYLFIAGGIGITPIIPMISAVVERGAEWTLIFGGRTTRTMAFVDELKAVDTDHHIQVIPQDVSGFPDLAGAISTAAAGTAVYCCGPEGLIGAVEAVCADHPEVTLHVERFNASPKSADALADKIDSAPFELELCRSGIVLTVPADRTTLQVVRELRPDYPFNCEEGFCGSCEAAVIHGVPDHRDDLLTDEERAENKTMMICVGRSLTPRLGLDI